MPAAVKSLLLIVFAGLALTLGAAAPASAAGESTVTGIVCIV